MGNSGPKLFFMALTLYIGAAAFAEQSYIIIRNGQNELNNYCKALNCKPNIIETDTKEFANGNTFVRFKQSVSGKDIIIVSPPTLDANQFMELLIKVRTSKTDFANSVSVVTPDKTETVRVLDDQGKEIVDPNLVKIFLSDSGADKLNSKKLSASHKKSTVKRSQRNIVVDLGTNSPLAKMISSSLSIPLIKIEALLEKGASTGYNLVVVSSLPDPHNQSFLNALNSVYKLKLSGANTTLVTPYLPYARSDKKDQMGVSVIGRLAADLIESSGTDSISFVRAHAPQSQGFFKIPSIQTMGRKTINTYLQSQGVEQIISPDAGFQKDATLYADELGLPVSVINKQRDLQTGESKLHDMSGPQVHGKIVAVIDDETASGGTLGKAAEFLKKQGAKKVIAVVTHLAGSAKQALDSPYLDTIAVTDTFEVKTEHPKLKVLSLAPELSSDLKQMLGIAISCSQAYKD